MDAFLYRVKAAQRDLIERCGGIGRAEAITGFSKSQVGRWNNPNDPDLMPLGAVKALEGDCKCLLVTAVMAEANGCRLSDPEAERRAEVNVLSAHAEMMRQAAEVAHSVAMAIVDRSLAMMERTTSDMRAACAVIKARGGEKAALRVVGEGE